MTAQRRLWGVRQEEAYQHLLEVPQRSQELREFLEDLPHQCQEIEPEVIVIKDPEIVQ